MINKNLFIHSQEEAAFKEMMDRTYFHEEIMDHFRNFDEKLKMPDLLGKTVQVTKTQFKEVYNMVEDLAKLNEINIPNVYVYEDFYYGVESKGSTEPWIEISAKTLLDLKKEELLFLLGREICNIKFNYTYYNTLISETLNAAANNNIIMGMETFSKALKLTMYKWSRAACYTADCFGFIMSKDLSASVNAILKLILNNSYLVENMNISEYIGQAEKINELDDKVFNYTKMDELIPYGPFRIKNLIAYASSERGIKAIKEL
jgi:hypothetical protein